MPTFTYTARTSAGQLREGHIDVANRAEAVSYLRRRQLTPVRVEQNSARVRGGRAGQSVGIRELVIFTRQLATMINSGLPLAQSLDLLARQSENANLRRVIERMLSDIESGQSLAETLGAHPKLFSELYRNMVAAGETGGVLDTILLRLAIFLEKSDELRRKIKGAMIYPIVILTVAAVAVGVLLALVIPTFEQMFESAGVPLPTPTRLVLALSALLQQYWYAILIGGGALMFLSRQYYGTAAGRLALDRMMLRVPVLGPLQRKAAIARFTRTLGTLISSGVAILEGLEITARTAGNRVLHDAIMAARSSIAAGQTISEPLKRSGVFPALVVQMIHVGEQTGGLDEMLARIADFYDTEVAAAVEALLAIIEPILIVLVGIVVGSMIIAMYLPIFDLINAVE